MNTIVPYQANFGGVNSNLSRNPISPTAFSGANLAPISNLGQITVSSALPLLSTLGFMMGLYHGYKRDQESVGWAIGWAFFGGILAPIAIPVMFIQGFGKPA